MAGKIKSAALLYDVQTLFGFGVVRDASDRQLLEQFLTAARPDAEAAFTRLVERHGPMVLQVCRQALDGPHDVQDAFQTTFLVFLRKAGSIRRRDSLASWLFGVAMRVARRTRYAAIARRFHERQAVSLSAGGGLVADEPSETLKSLHAEIARLPMRYQEPIVLCHLQGLSTAAAAERLGCAQGTILSRLARGRARLRQRLGRPGQGDAVLLMLSLRAPATGPSPTLVASTVQFAMRSLAGRSALAAVISPFVAVLSGATLSSLFLARTTLVSTLFGTFVAGSLLTIPIHRPSLLAGSQPALTGEKTRGFQQKPPSTEQELVRSRDLEEALYKILKRDHEFNDPRWSFVIKVREVEGKNLIDATFVHRVNGKNNEYDARVQAKSALLRFDPRATVVRAYLQEPQFQFWGRESTLALNVGRVLEIPIPPGDPLSDWPIPSTPRDGPGKTASGSKKPGS